MKGVKLFLLFSIILISCSGANMFIDQEHSDWNKRKAPSESELVYSIHLIGDAGAPSLDVQEPVLKLFQSKLESAGEHSAAIFLGDNIYLNGLPDSTHPDRSFYEARINEQLNTVQNYDGKVVFIPGNHDWDDGGKDGWNAIRRQESYIETYLNKGNTFLPDNGFPGPVEIKLMDEDDDPRLRQDIRLVALDTQWWLHPHKKPFGDSGEFDVHDAGDVVNELTDIIRDRKNDYLIVAGHHPLISKGTHAGYFPLSVHVKPPVFGSLYVLYRRLFGYKQDLTHPLYKSMIESIEGALQEKEEIMYVSGHAHSIQYNKVVHQKRYFQHHIVSGAGSKTAFVAKGRGAEFNYGGKGFVVLKIYEDGSVWMEAWSPVGDGSKGELLYKTQIQEPFGDPLADEKEEILPDYDYNDSTVVMAANPGYDKYGTVKELLLGSNRRDLWSVEAEFPVFDVTEIEGGLEVVRSGGKGQSNTLHLDGSNKREFVLRSVDKQAGKVWSEELRRSFALEVAQDQFSMLDPYAALVVSELAEAAEVLHVKPTIYFVPDDPLLGSYGDLVSGELALFEQKPDNNMSDVASVNFAEEVMGWTDMIREVDGDIDHRVDQELMARSRLFDMLIGDWDRHYDQWRWAAIEPADEKGKIYQPIPRDRDVALMNLNGIGPTLAKLGPFFQYQNTTESYGNLKGLNYNSLGITRRFTNQLNRQDWLNIAEEIQSQLTDERIDQAVKAYPNPVYKEHGPEMAEILKVRRDKLVEVASKYYDLISKVVSVPASHKRELFEIHVLDENTIRLMVYKLSGKGKTKEKYYERVFKYSETRELRLFGLGDDDRFEITGDYKNNIRIRIIGGAGDDEIIDLNSDVKRKLFVYDTKKGNDFELGKGARINTSEDPAINEYDLEKDYDWNSIRVKLFFNYNGNDGVFIGGGPSTVRRSFRKMPAFEQSVMGNLAPVTMAANIKYNGDWYKLLNKWDVYADGDMLLPGSYRYFYGLGNETLEVQQRSLNYYRGLLSQFDFESGIRRTINNFMNIELGAGIIFTDVKDVQGQDNILTNPQLGINPNIFNDQSYTSVKTNIGYSDVGNNVNPEYGISLSLEGEQFIGMNEFSTTHTKLSSELKLFYTASTSKQLTFAGRVGGEHIIGSFPFYQTNSIGGSHNLRGFNNQRFSGRSSFYSNNELRFELFDFYNYYIGGKLGAITFFDIGRVWTDGENSTLWHKGYGGGIWFNIFDAVLVSGYFGKSVEGHSIAVSAGFFF